MTKGKFRQKRMPKDSCCILMQPKPLQSTASERPVRNCYSPHIRYTSGKWSSESVDSPRRDWARLSALFKASNYPKVSAALAPFVSLPIVLSSLFFFSLSLSISFICFLFALVDVICMHNLRCTHVYNTYS